MPKLLYWRIWLFVIVAFTVPRPGVLDLEPVALARSRSSPCAATPMVLPLKVPVTFAGPVDFTMSERVPDGVAERVRVEVVRQVAGAVA